MVDMRILSDPYEEECFLILKSNLPKMKDEDALELYVNYLDLILRIWSQGF